MSKNKAQKKRKDETQINAELSQALEEKYAVLKGGKIGAIARPADKRKNNEFTAEYTLNGKLYKVTGRYNPKRGEVAVSQIEEAAPVAEL